MKTYLHTLCFLSISLALWGCGETDGVEYKVADQTEFQEVVGTLKPGDTLVLANGTWSDFEILFQAHGTAENPISLRAEESGKVVLTGQSNLRLAGEHLVVSGLVFKDGYSPSSEVIAFRGEDDEYAYHSRVTEVVVDNYNQPERTETDYWVALYGKHNRFDHSHLEGKRNRGVTLAVRLNSEESQENHHLIDHNYFGPRPVLGANGGETLRIGTSTYSLSDSFTVVENNYFDRADGELEIISNKSGGNVFRGNVFFESRGTLTMRHGNGNLVENNVFFGNGVEHTGGIRVINADQTIRNNYMEGLAGYRFGGALVVMNGVPDSPINRYHQVTGALIENNTVVESDYIQLAAGSDPERSAVPTDSDFNNNLISHSSGTDTFTIYDDISGIRFAGNILNEVESFQIKAGFESANFELVRAENGLLYPTSEDLASAGVAKDLVPVAKEQTGVSWYPKSAGPTEFGSGKVIAVASEESLIEALTAAAPGDVFSLAAGDYEFAEVLKIDLPLSIQAAAGAEVSLRYGGTALFEIQDGGSLSLRGLTISGQNAPESPNNAVVRTQASSMLVNYRLHIEDCLVEDLAQGDSFALLSVAKSTLADEILVRDSHFKNISGTVFELNSEDDDRGVFNADYLTIEDSSFADIQGSLVEFYRGGRDESTFGPHFRMVDSTLSNVGRGSANEVGRSILLHGVQVTHIKDNQFLDSNPILVRHTVGEPRTSISSNQFSATAAPIVEELNSDKTNTAKIFDNRFE